MFTSNANWTKIGFSQDTHATREQAIAVCNMLLDEYGNGPGCPTRGLCTAAWVEEIKDHGKEGS